MRHVILGASAAGISCIKQLRKFNQDDEIILISKDETIYSRCLLYHYLNNDKELEELNFAGLMFEKTLNVQWIKGQSVKDIDVVNKKVILENQEVSYDNLVLSTGGSTRQLPIPHFNEASNVVGFRNIEDVMFIKSKLDTVSNILVVGAVLVGVDVLYGLINYNKNLTLVDMAGHIIPTLLDTSQASIYEDKFKECGVNFYFNDSIDQCLTSNNTIKQVILKSGKVLDVDLIINCAGVKANIDYLKNTPIQTNQYGLIIDELGKTNIDHIYGAGDITGTMTLWPVAIQEGIQAAYTIYNQDYQKTNTFNTRTSMHFFDIYTCIQK